MIQKRSFWVMDHNAFMDCCHQSEKQVYQHRCWVCAYHEDFVQEPSVFSKGTRMIRRALVDVRVDYSIGSLALLSGATIVCGDEGREMAANASFFFITRVLFAGLLVLISILVGNTWLASQPELQVSHSPPTDIPIEEKQRFGELLSGAIRFKTISYDKNDVAGNKVDYAALVKFHQYLVECFPHVHACKHIRREVINGHSLVYEWSGSGDALLPVMLCAHLDVVATPSASQWTYPPFDGHIDDDGVVWGRGAIDNKHNVMMQLNAVEELLKGGTDRLPRTVFFAFGHDEEIGGIEGAKFIAEHVSQRLGPTRKLEFILDEGPFIIKGIIPGVEGPVGLIGNCEKGSVSLKLSVDSFPQGHSSMPGPESNVGILSSAISRLEQNPFPSHTRSQIDSMISLGSALPFMLRLVISNFWLFKPIIDIVILKKNSTAAACRTTTAITILRGGSKVNMIPGEAHAWVNHRIHPSENVQGVINYDTKIINDPRVRIAIENDDATIDPAPVSSIDSRAFKLLKNGVARVFNAPVMPVPMIGNTDTRHYWELADNIYRFSPVLMESPDDLTMFHGLNERISIDNLAKMHAFYTLLLVDL